MHTRDERRQRNSAGRLPDGGLAIGASDQARARAFANARRHTWLVKGLRLVLPLVTLACAASYGAALYASSLLRSSKISVAAVRIDPTNLTMQAPRYNGFAKDGSQYKVRAESAVTDLKMSGPVRLNVIDGDLVQPTGVLTHLKAKWGTYDQKADVLELFEKIDVLGSTGMKARLTRATVYTKESRIVSREPIWAETTTGTIRARSMDANTKTHQAAFRDDVEVTLKPNPAAKKDEGAETAAKSEKRAAPLAGLQMSSGLPVVVTSARLDVDDAQHTALFRESVIARQGEAVLQAPELDVLYEGKASDGIGGPADTTKAAATKDEQARLKFIRARGGVVMTNRGDRADSATLDYDASTEQITLAGDVVMTQEPDRRVTAQTALIDQKADTVLMTGGVVVNQARNIMRSTQLAIDRKAGIARLASPASHDHAAGRISTLLYQAAAAKPGAPAKEKPAEAQPDAGLGLFSSGFKSDPNAPIDVEAATLDIFDRRHTAVYVGKVVAKQGDFVVRTEEMTAHYTGETGIASGAAAPKPHDKARAADGSPQSAAQLKRIEARKGVIVTGKNGQQATGEWANFDVKANTVVMGGQVVVTQPDAAVAGRQQTLRLPDGIVLVMDLTSGVTRTEIAPGRTAGPALPDKKRDHTVSGPQTSSAFSTAVSSLANAKGGVSPACPKGAVCRSGRLELILYPNNPEKSKVTAGGVTVDGADLAKPKKPRGEKGKAKATATEESSWSSTTEPQKR